MADHWKGQSGLTDGRQFLGTPPHKDIGYPYASTCWGERLNGQINNAMFGYSWHSYLVETTRYARWVDKGRPSPTHEQWASYLEWVAEKADADLRIATVSRIESAEGRWQLHCKPIDGGAAVEEGDGLLITGPGDAVRIKGQPDSHPRIMDGRTFWQNVESFRGSKGASIMVIGSGETAASVAVALVNNVHSSTRVRLLASHGSIYSRGESFVENSRFTDPANWCQLTEEHRRECIERTDRGVFSLHANSVLDLADNVRIDPGKAIEITEASNDRVVLKCVYSGREDHLSLDYLILAHGFNAMWFQELLGTSARLSLEKVVGNWSDGEKTRDGDLRKRVEPIIGRDLAVEGHLPRLHVPMMAAFAQGPGFPNLSSLGLLSDRILKPYVSAADLHLEIVRDEVSHPGYAS